MVKYLRGLFIHERLNPAIIRTIQGNVYNTAVKATGKYRYDSVTKKVPKITIICSDRYIFI